MNFDVFALIAELSLGLLGFSGVAAAFGGRERAFNYVERVRFLGIVVHSATPLFGCLAVYVFSSAGFGAADTITGAVAFSLVLYLAFMGATLPSVMRSGRDDTTSTEKWAVAVVWIHMFVTLILYALSILGGGIAWPLIAAYSTHLAMGIFVLWRILMRAD